MEREKATEKERLNQRDIEKVVGRESVCVLVCGHVWVCVSVCVCVCVCVRCMEKMKCPPAKRKSY